MIMSDIHHGLDRTHVGIGSLSLDGPGSGVIEPDISSPPISLLPPELLSLIFQEACDSTVNGRVPSIIASVSRAWREVATSNPLLWNCVSITLPLNLNAIASKLKLSKESPLDLHIIITDHETKDKSFESLLPVVAGSYYRCRRLHIEGHSYHPDNVIRLLLGPMLNLSMPYLEKFMLTGRDSGEEASIETWRGQDLFSAAPNLKYLCLGGIGLLNYRPPLTNVTTLHLLSPLIWYPYEAFASLAQSCSNLTFLAIYDDLFPRGQPNSSGTACKLSHLESLFLMGTMTSVSELLLFISAPKLRELVIAPSISEDLMLLQMHQRSNALRFPNLQSLTMAPVEPSGFPGFQSASECFPALKRLIIAQMYREEFESIFGEHDPPLFPALRELAVSNVLGSDFLEVMDRVLKKRGTSNPWIETLFMDTQSIQRIDPSRRRWSPYGENILVEANLWEEQRLRAMHTEDAFRFLGESDTWQSE